MMISRKRLFVFTIHCFAMVDYHKSTLKNFDATKKPVSFGNLNFAALKHSPSKRKSIAKPARTQDEVEASGMFNVLISICFF